MGDQLIALQIDLMLKIPLPRTQVIPLIHWGWYSQ